MSLSRYIAALMFRRSRLRMSLTAMAISVAITLVCLLITMPVALEHILSEAASMDRISIHHQAGLVYSLPRSFVRKVRAVDGVDAAIGTVWFGGVVDENRGVPFPSFAVEAEHVSAVYPDYGIAPEHQAAFEANRNGALVGQRTLDQFGWKLGDRVTLSSTVWPVHLELQIVGLIPRKNSPEVWVNLDYLDLALQEATGEGVGEVGIIWARVADPSAVSEAIQRVDAMSANSGAETVSETEQAFFKSFFGSLEGIVGIILVVAVLVGLCIVSISLNTASMNVRERTGEIATLKAIGFPTPRILFLLAAEPFLVSSAAGVIGIAVAYFLSLVVSGLSGSGEVLGPLASFTMTPEIALQGLVLSLAIGLLSGLLPAGMAVKRPAAQVLREVS